MKAELSAGSTYVIAEAREAGNGYLPGHRRGQGRPGSGKYLHRFRRKNPVGSAAKAQQLYFLELIGCNVNLGNIAPAEVLPLEAMRIGLRGDTFNLYLNK